MARQVPFRLYGIGLWHARSVCVPVALAFLSSAACSLQLDTREFDVEVQHPRAIVEIANDSCAISHQAALPENIGIAPPRDRNWFRVVRGSMPVFVTAPHVTRVMRDGGYRFADGGGTGALALALNRMYGATTVCTVYDSPSVPNYYDDNGFKKTLGPLIDKVRPTLLLDIHASHPFRPYEVDIGTMNGDAVRENADIVDRLQDAVLMEGLHNESHNWFAGSRNQTVIKYAAARNIPAVQLEFSALRLMPTKEDEAAHRFAQTLQAMIRFLDRAGYCRRPAETACPVTVAE